MEDKCKLAVCKKVKKLRRMHGYSQEKTAEMLNMAQNTYSDFESGKTKSLDTDRLRQIATLFKVSLSDLLDTPSLKLRY